MKKTSAYLIYSSFILLLIPSLGYDLYSHTLTFSPYTFPGLDEQNIIHIFGNSFPRYSFFSYLQVISSLGGLLPSASIFLILNFFLIIRQQVLFQCSQCILAIEPFFSPSQLPFRNLDWCLITARGFL